MVAHAVQDQQSGVLSLAAMKRSSCGHAQPAWFAPCRITTVMIRFIPGEAGCWKMFGRSHFGGSFTQSGVVFLC
jgi:hypothetical protein